MTKIYTRKNKRLARYDYTSAGLYYVTICTYNRIEYFGNIINDPMRMSDAGQMTETVMNEMAQYYPGTIVDEFIVMPNHVHIIIEITEYVGAAPLWPPESIIKSK